MECVPEQSQKFLLELINGMNELIESQQDVSDAKALYEMALEKSQEARKMDGSIHPAGKYTLQRLTQLSDVISKHAEPSRCLKNFREAVAKEVQKKKILKSCIPTPR